MDRRRAALAILMLSLASGGAVIVVRNYPSRVRNDNQSTPSVNSHPTDTVTSSAVASPSVLPLPIIRGDSSPTLPASLVDKLPLPDDAVLVATSQAAAETTQPDQLVTVYTTLEPPLALAQAYPDYCLAAGLTVTQPTSTADETILICRGAIGSLVIHINLDASLGKTWFDVVVSPT